MSAAGAWLDAEELPAGPPEGPAVVSFTRRLVGALLLRPWAYREVAADRHGLPHAIAVVLLAALARDAYRFSALWAAAGAVAVWFGLLLGIASWLLFSLFSFPVIRLVCATPVRFGRLLRCLGFAESPWLLMLPAGLWPLGEMAVWLQFAVAVWQFPAIALAAQAAARVPARRAFAAAALAYGGYIALGVWLRTVPA